MAMPLPKHEYRCLHLEGEHHTLQWRCVLVLDKVVDKFGILASILTRPPFSVIGDTG
jgi:hypothetical protein